MRGFRHSTGSQPLREGTCRNHFIADYIQDLGANTIWSAPSPQTLTGAGATGLIPIRTSRAKLWLPRLLAHRFDRNRPPVWNDGRIQCLGRSHYERDQNILVDYVANHVRRTSRLSEHQDWVTNLYLPDGSLNTQLWDEQRLTTWFDTFMPTLDLERPEFTKP